MSQAIQTTAQSCCRRTSYHNTFSYLRLAEQASVAGLAALAAYTNFSLFAPFLLLGTAIGIHQHRYGEQEAVNNRNGVSCSQGFLEQLTRVKLPPLASLGVNLAITLCHLEHHSRIFVPIIGLSIGAQLGQKVSLAIHST